MTSTFLSGKEIKDAYIQGRVKTRDISIDMYIDCVIKNGEAIRDTIINIKPQEMVIVVLDGTVQIPPDCFAITYPKTSLTQKGIHVLNTGIVDPGYDGYLSTIIINYSKNQIELRRKEDVCFRLMLYKSENPYPNQGAYIVDHDDYIKSRCAESKKYPDTFLDIGKQKDAIIKDVFQKVKNSVITVVIVGATVLTLLLQLVSSFILDKKYPNANSGEQSQYEIQNTDILEFKEELRHLNQQLDELKKQKSE